MSEEKKSFSGGASRAAIQRANVKNKNTPPQPAIEKSYSEALKERLTIARNSPEAAKLSDEQKQKGFELLEIMVSQSEKCHVPVLDKDKCSIEMGLMHGGTITIVSPTGYHVMQGKRQMKASAEKGDTDEMLPTYIMAACSSIDGDPVSLLDLQDKLTARDFNIALSYFCRINLL